MGIPTAILAPHLPFAIPAGIGSIGWIAAVRRTSGTDEAGRSFADDPLIVPTGNLWATLVDHCMIARKVGPDEVRK